MIHRFVLSGLAIISFSSCGKEPGTATQESSTLLESGEEFLLSHLYEQGGVYIVFDAKSGETCECNRERFHRLESIVTAYPFIRYGIVVIPENRLSANGVIQVPDFPPFGKVYIDHQHQILQRYPVYKGTSLVILNSDGDVAMAFPLEIEEIPDLAIHKVLNML